MTINLMTLAFYWTVPSNFHLPTRLTTNATNLLAAVSFLKAATSSSLASTCRDWKSCSDSEKEVLAGKAVPVCCCSASLRLRTAGLPSRQLHGCVCTEQ